jgi:hypothetical protein
MTGAGKASPLSKETGSAGNRGREILTAAGSARRSSREDGPPDVHSTSVKVVGGFLGLLLAAFVGLIGLFLILYTGDAGNEQDIYVSFWDMPRIDADFIGVPLVVIALALVVVSLRALRRGGIP